MTIRIFTNIAIIIVFRFFKLNGVREKTSYIQNTKNSIEHFGAEFFSAIAGNFGRIGTKAYRFRTHLNPNPRDGEPCF
jgi:hypothetical protein